jgi:hypothetical protein
MSSYRAGGSKTELFAQLKNENWKTNKTLHLLKKYS